MPKWTKPAIAVCLILYLGLQVLSFNVQRDSSLSFPERVVVWVTSPVQGVVTGMVEWAGGIWDHYVYLIHVSKEQEDLELERDLLKRKLIQAKEVELENHRLRELLDMSFLQNQSWILAERIALGASNYERVIRVNRGRKEGVTQGAAVMHPRGMVGQVLEVFGRSSDILLLVDLASAIDVVCQRSRAKGILKGVGVDELRFEYLSRKEDVQKGDQILSSGLDGVYPEGIPVGVVTEVSRSSGTLFMSAKVKPHVDFTKLEEVSILLKEKRNSP